MKLSDAQNEALSQHIEAISRNRFICPVCGERDFTMLEHLYELHKFGAEYPLTAPVVVLVCHYCSALYFFSANVLDLTSKGGSDPNTLEIRRDNLASRIAPDKYRNDGTFVVLPPMDE